MNFDDRIFLKTRWPKCIVGPDMEKHDRQSDGPGTLCDGVYFLFDGATLVYVGKSGYVRQRIHQHRLLFRPFTHWGAIPVMPALLSAIESAYISALRPIQNNHVPITYETWQQEIVDAVLDAWRVSATERAPSEGERENGEVYAETQ